MSDAFTTLAELHKFFEFLDALPIPMAVSQVTAVSPSGVNPWRSVFHNKRFLQIVGYTVEDVPDRETWYRIAYPDEAYRAERIHLITNEADSARVDPRKQFSATTVRIRCKDGEDRWFEIAENYGVIDDGSYFVSAMTDVSALHNARVQIERLARTDVLTGLRNRRAMQDELAAAHSRMSRSGLPYTCVLGDIDHFKEINDAFGHECGDHVLVAVASVLESSLRASDVVARWGGEEFCLLLADTDAKQTERMMNRLRASLANHPMEWKGALLAVTMTFGVATQQQSESVEEALRRADAAMYAGKRAGRNRVMLAD
jgi:diguanylate cyclase (GGDEF)-like protein/PAS domain S-box-containing protein